jgi:hypothetical protein
LNKGHGRSVLTLDRAGALKRHPTVFVKPSARRARSPRGWCAAAVVVALCGSRGAHAAEPVPTLAERLRSNPDFRVRTQAALALGASSSEAAVKPLCDGLDDSSTTVRAASAAALGRLARGGKDCLQSRRGEETNASVKTVIDKALSEISSGGGAKGPEVTANTRYYVAVGPTTDKSGRSDGSVDGMVREAMVQAASEAGEDYAIAPSGESASDAQKVLKKNKSLKAYFLWPKVSPPDYAGGNLTIRVEVSIFTYPNRALKAVVPMKLTMPGVDGTDRDSENDLIKMAVSKAFQKFSASAASID